MTRTDTLTGSGECRDKGQDNGPSSPAGAAGSELPGEFFTRFSPDFHSNGAGRDRLSLL
jgi:hypothetical protein